jgi:hypothetical protein
MNRKVVTLTKERIKKHSGITAIQNEHCRNLDYLPGITADDDGFTHKVTGHSTGVLVYSGLDTPFDVKKRQAAAARNRESFLANVRANVLAVQNWITDTGNEAVLPPELSTEVLRPLIRSIPANYSHNHIVQYAIRVFGETVPMLHVSSGGRPAMVKLVQEYEGHGDIDCLCTVVDVLFALACSSSVFKTFTVHVVNTLDTLLRYMHNILPGDTKYTAYHVLQQTHTRDRVLELIKDLP